VNGESCGVLEHCDSALTNAAADCFAAATSKGYIRFCLESRKKKTGWWFLPIPEIFWGWSSPSQDGKK